MLRFKVHQLRIRGKYYLLLPKLNSAQMRILGDRLARLGYDVRASGGLGAKSKDGTVYVDPSGFCRSSFDPSDLIYPAIPGILAVKKEPLPLEALTRLYFGLESFNGNTVVRMSTRIESSSNWDVLRSLGECGLTPDERTVSSFLIGNAEGDCEILCDFPMSGSLIRIYGRRRYYDSVLDTAQAASTLRIVGQKGSRNTYLPRDGILRLKGQISPSREDVLRLLAELGDWCFLTPA